MNMPGGLYIEEADRRASAGLVYLAAEGKPSSQTEMVDHPRRNPKPQGGPGGHISGRRAAMEAAGQESVPMDSQTEQEKHEGAVRRAPASPVK